MDANERKMAHAGINTDPLPVLGAVDIQPSYRLKERCVPHVRITHVDELKQMYDFGNVIGRGGFGTVLTVKEKYTTKEWAMKTVFKSAAGERLKLVKREIQILKLITHPHIIYLDRIFESPKKIYMIFEKCCGELGKIYNEKKPFSEATARKIVMEIAEAVAYLHKFDIVHRDLKMENILIGLNPRDPNDEYYVKVTDFGLSIMKSGSGVDDMLHDYCGTITYMAPEMLSTCSYSQQCDTWAIGVILYMLVMGKYPFFSQDEKQLRYQICNDNLKFDQTIKLAPALEDLLKKTLVKNPAFRMTATEILEHPWIQNKTMNACGTKGNILDIMKEWKQELLLPGEESDWTLHEDSNQGAAAAVEANTRSRRSTKDEVLVRIVNPIRQELPLAKTELKFERGSISNKRANTPAGHGVEYGGVRGGGRERRESPYQLPDPGKSSGKASAPAYRRLQSTIAEERRKTDTDRSKTKT